MAGRRRECHRLAAKMEVGVDCNACGWRNLALSDGGRERLLYSALWKLKDYEDAG